MINAFVNYLFTSNRESHDRSLLDYFLVCLDPRALFDWLTSNLTEIEFANAYDLVFRPSLQALPARTAVRRQGFIKAPSPKLKIKR
jgi:hypothetical protein